MSNTIVRMWLDSKRYWGGMILALFIAALAGVFKTLSAFYWGAAIDEGIEGYINPMVINALLMLLFIALDAIRTAILYTIVGYVTEGMFRDVRVRIFSTLTTAEMGRLETDMRSGDIAVRANNNVSALCDVIAGDFTNYARLIFQALIAVVACFVLSWQLSIIFVLILPITLIVLKLIMKPIEAIERDTRQNLGRSANIALDAITGINAVKIYKLESAMSKRFDSIVDENYIRFNRLARVGMWTTAIKYIVHIVQILILFIAGAWLVEGGLITVGAVLAFIAVSAYITEGISMADQMMLRAKRAKVLADRIYEILDLPQEVTGEERQLTFENPVQFENVFFAYNNEEMVLKNLTLIVKEGEKVAIVGKSGSGKSTIIKLITRLYTHSEGRLRVFGLDAEKIDLHALRSKVAIVTQESFLFEGSILDNVRLGQQSASAQMVTESLRASGLWDFVESLPRGLDTLLSEFGSNLSGGQRQRLCIARALVREPKLILLDEPTSALDVRTEQALQQALDILLKDRTAIIVTHRMSTIQNVDYVYCIDKGMVVEEGTPLQLFKKQGYYYEMCKFQEAT